MSKQNQKSQDRARNGRGFTLIELLVVIAIIALLIGILLPAIGQVRKGGRQIKDGTQVRGIQQAMVVWAQQNADDYPLPSRIDKQNYTVSVPAGQEYKKDLSRHIFSMMVANGSLPTEILYNPAEASASVKVMDGYEFEAPTAAADPTRGLWDPKFRATPLDAAIGVGAGTEGNCSYAHNPPFGKRRAKWSNSFASTECVVGDRGPCFTLSNSGGTSNWTLLGNSDFGDRSVTLLIHGSRTKWEGNEAFNDNHVEFMTRADPESLTFSFATLQAGQRTRPDNIFINENDNTQVSMGGDQAAGPAGMGSYLDGNVSANGNSYLRPYSDVLSGSASLQIKAWVD